MSLTRAISMWLLVTYVLIASASIPDRIVPLRVRQPSTQLRSQEHREQYQETFLQAAVQPTSPTLSLTAASNSSSYHPIDNEALSESSDQVPTHANTTQLVESLEGLDLARAHVISGHVPNQEQHNGMSNDSDEEECPSGIDTLDCDECGGPEHTWEIAHNVYHCKGIEAEDYRWKDCYCLWDDPAHVRGPCTFDTGSDDGSSQDGNDSDHDTRRATDSDVDRENKDSEETSAEAQHNSMSIDVDEQGCPAGIDMLECEDCGGPEHTWEIIHNDYHCKGIEAEDYRWKDCPCLNWDDPYNCRCPCTIDSDSDDGCLQHDTDLDDAARHKPDADDSTGHGSDSDDDVGHHSACEADN